MTEIEGKQDFARTTSQMSPNLLYHSGGDVRLSVPSAALASG